MEKRRRERINKSLEELKRLVLEAQHRDSSRYTKLEKADILEMTVKHLRSLRNRPNNVTSCRQLLGQTLPPGIHFGCVCCVPDVDRNIAPTNVVMETNRIQPVAGHLGVSQEDNRNITSVKYETNLESSDSRSVTTQRASHPLHRSTALQFIPVCSSEYANVFPSTPESSRAFWRPF